MIDDGLPQNTLGDRIATRYNDPDGAPGFYQVVSAFPYVHNDSPGSFHKGINNSYTASFLIWGCVQNPLNCSVP